MTILTPDMKAKSLTMANIPRLLLVCKPLHIINYAVLPKLMPTLQEKRFMLPRIVGIFLFSMKSYLSFSLPPARMMESMSHEVELRSAEPEIIELLIEFIYTAR